VPLRVVVNESSAREGRNIPRALYLHLCWEHPMQRCAVNSYWEHSGLNWVLQITDEVKVWHAVGSENDSIAEEHSLGI